MSLGLLCPGQGEQSPAMLARLPARGPGAALLEVAGAILGCPPARLPAAALHRNAVAQPLVAAVELATWEALRGRLPEVRGFAGYSLGELVAHGCAGALDGAEVVRLAARRASLMDAASTAPGGLRAVRGLARAEVERVCARHGLELAIVNGPDRLVVGGLRAALDAAEPELVARGARVTALPVEVASHTSRMAPAVEPFRAALAASGLRPGTAPVLAGLDGAPVRTPARAVETLSRQLAEPVQWAACLEGLVELGCRALLELGPGAGLARMARDLLPELPVRSVEEFRTLEGVVEWAAHAVG